MVDRIITDLAVLDVGAAQSAAHLRLVEPAPGVSEAQVRDATGVGLH